MTEASEIGGRIRSFVERIEYLQAEIDGLNADKSEIFTEVRHIGLDAKVIRSLIKERKDTQAAREHNELLDLYRAAIDGTPIATRAPAQEKRSAAGPTIGADAANRVIPAASKEAAPAIASGGSPAPITESAAEPASPLRPWDNLDIPAFLDRRTPAGHA